MLGRKRKLLEDLGFAADIVLGAVALGTVFGFLKRLGPQIENLLFLLTGFPFRIQPVVHLQEEAWLSLILLTSSAFALRWLGPYPLDLTARWLTVAGRLLRSTAGAFATATVFFYLFSIADVNRSLLLGYSGLHLFLLLVKERLFRLWLLGHHLRRRPLEVLLACPAGDVERQVQRASEPSMALRIRGIVPLEGTADEVPAPWREAVVGGVEDLPRILAQGRYDAVFVRESPGGRAANRVLAAAEEQGVEAWLFADVLSAQIARPRVDEFGGRPVIVFKTTDHYEGRLLVKRAFDIAVAGTLVLLLSPLLVTLALAVRLTSPGPALFVQERTGWKGRTFRMFKFRTMVVDAEARRAALAALNEMRGPTFKITDDPRMTPIGRVLRRYSLDELPQLFNVLRGEMSLVGPRPLPVYETEKFPAFRDRRRYSVLPGLTGLWQVSGRSDIEDFGEWVRLDLEYIDRWSLWLDLRILLRTIPVVLGGGGAR